MLFTHMDQLGFVVRKIEADGLIRIERLGGVPERALPSQAVLHLRRRRARPHRRHRQQEPSRDDAGREIQGRALCRPLYRCRLRQPRRSACRRRRHRHAHRLPAAGAGAFRQPHRRHLGRRPRRLRRHRRGGARIAQAAQAPDRPFRLFGAGGIQPPRRGDRRAGAAARHRDPARPAACHRHARHGLSRRRQAGRRAGDEHVLLPWPRHAERHHPASRAGRAVRCDSQTPEDESAAQRPHRRADRFLLCAAGRQRRRLDRPRLSHALFAFLAGGLRSRRSRPADDSCWSRASRRSMPASASIATTTNELLSRHRHRHVRVERRDRRRQGQDRRHRLKAAQDAGAATGLGRAQAKAGLVGRLHPHM